MSKIGALLVFVGIIIVYGTAAASDSDVISFGQTVAQTFFGFSLGVIGYVMRRVTL